MCVSYTYNNIISEENSQNNDEYMIVDYYDIDSLPDLVSDNDIFSTDLEPIDDSLPDLVSTYLEPIDVSLPYLVSYNDMFSTGFISELQHLEQRNYQDLVEIYYNEMLAELPENQ